MSTQTITHASAFMDAVTAYRRAVWLAAEPGISEEELERRANRMVEIEEEIYPLRPIGLDEAKAALGLAVLDMENNRPGNDEPDFVEHLVSLAMEAVDEVERARRRVA